MSDPPGGPGSSCVETKRSLFDPRMACNAVALLGCAGQCAAALAGLTGQRRICTDCSRK